MTEIRFVDNCSGARSQNSGAGIKRRPAKDFQDLIVWQRAQQRVSFRGKRGIFILLELKRFLVANAPRNNGTNDSFSLVLF